MRKRLNITFELMLLFSAIIIFTRKTYEAQTNKQYQYDFKKYFILI